VTWQRLDPRMLIIRPVLGFIRSIPVLAGALLLGHGSFWQWVGVAAAAFAVLTGVSRIVTTRYRITSSQIEFRTGLLRRRYRAVPRDRIRVVDRTSELKHRLFGLSAVKIGTGQHGHDDELVLDAVSSKEAQRLRTVLLGRLATVEEENHSTVLATVDKRWVRYAPFSLSGLAAVGAIVGAGWQLAHELHVEPSSFGPLQALVTWFADTPTWLVVVVLIPVLLAVVSVLSIFGYMLSFWNFELSREPGGTLHIRRGLLTTRSTSVEEERIRGVELKVPLPLRAVGGARCLAVVSGIHTSVGGGGVLLPPAPASRVHSVVVSVLGSDPTVAPLTAHPRAALSRRLTRAFFSVLFAALVFFWLFPADWPWVVALAFLPVAGLLGWDRYRNLGHAVVGPYLVSRSGSLRQDTVALRRSGIVGLYLQRSFFQRRSGLITVVATVAAGKGRYFVHDMAEADTVALAEAAVPGLFTPFLERVPAVEGSASGRP
jgi:putative membrane protein